MGWMTGSVPGRGNDGIFTLRHHVQTSSGAHQASVQWELGALTWGVKWPGCEADYLPSSSAEVNNAWRYTSTPQYVFMA